MSDEQQGSAEDDALQEQVADLYMRALELEKSGEREAAAEAYRSLLKLDPADHGGAAVRLAAMGLGDSPDGAPPAYVETLFDQHAAVFDNMLVEQLGYAVPLLVGDKLRAILDGRVVGRILDLGCGTGLSGEALRPLAREIVGVDISQGMLEIADEKDVYDELFVADVVGFLEADAEDDPEGKGPLWDVIVGTDLLPYMGDLAPLMNAASARLAPEGLLVLSTETLPDEVLGGRDYMVGDKQRFAHREGSVRERAEAAGLTVTEMDGIIVRYDEGQATPGHLLIAIK